MLLGMEEAIKKDKKRLVIMMQISFLSLFTFLFIFWKLQNNTKDFTSPFLIWLLSILASGIIITSLFLFFVSVRTLIKIKLGYPLSSCFFKIPWFEIALPNYKRWIGKSRW